MAAPPVNGAELNQRISDGGPIHQRTSLMRNCNSLQAVIMQEAWQAAGESLENPGEVDQWWFPEEGIVVFNLDP